MVHQLPFRRRRADTLALVPGKEDVQIRTTRMPCLTVMEGQLPGRLYAMRPGEITIGRALENDIALTDPRISRHHATMQVSEDAVRVVDAKSRNGTFVGGEVVSEAVLPDRAKFGLGPDVVLRLDWLDADDRAFQRRQFEALTRDQLTQCHNRLYLDEEFVRAASTALRLQLPLTVMVIDLDHFKRVNDDCGHAVGDAVLRDTAKTLREQVRGTDVLARVGGEEFVMLMPGSDLPTATAVAERIRAAVEARAHYLRGGKTIHVTLSAGVAALGEVPTTDPEALLSLADARVFLAKNSGRNCVISTGGAVGGASVWRMGTDQSEAVPVKAKRTQRRQTE
ncbi:MAG: GGDEF domain-containing protein [Myxococcales bacterium]|nr:GGDEF domain-containing protein [Myxococcales bacterium]